MLRSLLGLTVFIAGACGASTSYIYVPQGAAANGDISVRRAVPPERPDGDVTLVSLGLTDLPSGTARIRALHTRMVVTNDGDATPWIVDTREQLLEVPGAGRTAASYATSDRPATLPIVSVVQRGRAVIDLYFPLPPGVYDEAHFGGFDLLWQVATSTRTVSSRTTFERIAIEPYDDYYASATGPWSPYWGYYGGWGWPHTHVFYPHDFHGHGFIHGGGYPHGGSFHHGGGGFHHGHH